MYSWLKLFIMNNRKKLFLCGLMILLLFLVFVLSLSFGTVTIRMDEVFALLKEGRADSLSARIVLYTRLPRCIGSMFAGAALAVAGVIIQTVLSNPLAAPHVIGVNSAAGFFVALFGALFPQIWSAIPFVAFLGAFLGVLAVTVLAERADASKLSLVLAGVAMSSIFSAGIDAVVSLVPEALISYSDFKIGGFSGVIMKRMWLPIILIMAGILIALLLSHELDILALGRETAQSLGMRVGGMRTLFLLLVALLAGAAISFAGLLGFVGLIIPHVMRRLVGEQSCFLLAASALGGALLLSVCDLFARTLFSPYEISVGIVMSFLGGPFFLWMIFHQRRRAT